MNSSLYAEVELLATGLVPGMSIRTICPHCNGGNTHEHSFSITRDHAGLSFQCFRASCEVRGRITGSYDYYEQAKSQPTMPRTEAYTGPYLPLSGSDIDYFAGWFDLDVPEVGPIGVNDNNQYVLRIQDRDGTGRGYVVRGIPWSASPRQPTTKSTMKSKNYPDYAGALMQSIYRPTTLPILGRIKALPDSHTTIVVVEDQLSAMKAAQAGVTGVALLGVGMDLSKVAEIQSLQPKEVLFALDADAGHLAFQMAKKWGLAFPSVRVVLLSKDLKDTPADDVLVALGL